MSRYTSYYRKHWIQRKLLAAVILLIFPIYMTVALWVEYWEEDVKPGVKHLIDAIMDGRDA